MKLPLDWHKECIKNREIYLGHAMTDLEGAKRRVAQLQTDLDFAKAQLQKAIDKGLTEYDPDRFGVPRSKKA